MKVGLLFSGGKDSTLSAFLLSSQGFDVELITFIPENQESYMLHTPALEVTKYQASALNLPYHSFSISGEKEKEVEEMLSFLSSLDIEGIASGALASEYQKQRIDYIAHSLGIPSFSPLWHKGEAVLPHFKEMKIIFSSVSALGLSKELLGRDATPFLDKYEFFEGGDAETLVLDAPFFIYRLEVDYDVVWKGSSGRIMLKSIKLVEKKGKKNR